MKKVLFLVLSLAMVATLGLTGCNKTQKAIEGVGKELCADSGKGADKVVMNEAFAEFMGLLMFDAMKEMLGDDMTEEKFVAQIKDEMAKEKESKTEFESCSAKVEVQKCEEIYKAIASDEKMKELKDVEKKITEIGAKMGIKNCGVISATMKKKGDEKEQTVPVYVGEIKGSYKVFFAQEPK